MIREMGESLDHSSKQHLCEAIWRYWCRIWDKWLGNWAVAKLLLWKIALCSKKSILKETCSALHGALDWDEQFEARVLKPQTQSSLSKNWLTTGYERYEVKFPALWPNRCTLPGMAMSVAHCKTNYKWRKKRWIVHTKFIALMTVDYHI